MLALLYSALENIRSEQLHVRFRSFSGNKKAWQELRSMTGSLPGVVVFALFADHKTVKVNGQT